MNEIDELVTKHGKNGVLLDANLLILCLIGRMNPRRIVGFDRTSSFDARDYEILEHLLARFQKVITTPHILTEVSNLVGKLQQTELLKIRDLLAKWINSTLEVYEASSAVVTDTAYKSFGLTDAAISSLCQRDGILLLTADVALYGALWNRGLEAMNFKRIQALRLISN